MSDQRKHRRFGVDLLDISGDAVFARDLLICDISAGGVSVATDRRLEPGQQYCLRLIEEGWDLPVRGRVVWSEEQTGEPGHLAYAAGLQFTELSPEDRSRLLAFIAARLPDRGPLLAMHEMSGLRCNVRFRLDAREAAVLDVAEHYHVLTLSLGGLLFESGRKLDPETRIQMGISLPGKKPLSFTGRVTTCKPSSGSAGLYEIGMEFVVLEDQDRTVLKGYIRHLYLEDAGFPELEVRK